MPGCWGVVVALFSAAAEGDAEDVGELPFP
jgi:hypothetical protein